MMSKSSGQVRKGKSDQVYIHEKNNRKSFNDFAYDLRRIRSCRRQSERFMPHR